MALRVGTVIWLSCQHLTIALAAVAVLSVSCTSEHTADMPPADATYVGAATCGTCHEEQYRAWGDSLHAWAMKESTPEAAAATFDGRAVRWARDEVAYPRATGNALAVEIAGEGGRTAQYPLKYFFGHRPIEQHLVEFQRGKIQALPLGFDTRRGDWFDIFASDPRDPADWGYWTNAGMTANTQCLYCHTTAFEKGYVLETDEYRSSWAAMGVTCEACHGPGSRHAWRRRHGAPTHDDAYAPLAGEQMLDACAACHALRREIATGFRPGDRFLDFFEPILLDGDEYYADGQLREESYEWTSFLQSRKHGEGVACTACHNAHDTRVRAEGNELCLQCHDRALAAPAHVNHRAGSPGAQCVACHMPVTVYMERDPRRDHSFPLPDPQTTFALGVPSACDRCHAEEGPEWAAERVREWYGPGSTREERRRLAGAFDQARRGDPGSIDRLIDCLDHCPDVIRRASAARLLARFADRPGVVDKLAAAVQAADTPLVRASATWALAEVPPEVSAVRAALLTAATDAARAVRVNAAWGLRTLRADGLSADERDTVAGATREWHAAMALHAEHPETHHTLGVFYASGGDAERAEAAYRTAIELASEAVPPRYNLAMLLVGRGEVAEAEEQLRRVRALAPDFAPAAYALGMIYGEGGRWHEAIASLTDCLKIEPTYPGALYDLALAYVKVDRGDVAKIVPEAALKYPGTRREALRALIAVNLELGDRQTARRWARQASAEDPMLAADARVRELLAE